MKHKIISTLFITGAVLALATSCSCNKKFIGFSYGDKSYYTHVEKTVLTRYDNIEAKPTSSIYVEMPTTYNLWDIYLVSDFSSDITSTHFFRTTINAEATISYKYNCTISNGVIQIEETKSCSQENYYDLSFLNRASNKISLSQYTTTKNYVFLSGEVTLYYA